ncbi:hypothetical protein QQP08_011438 [Theobroma cacao]|nr:hypothetical protein QQP08_011438 [Theobroma cacao]
MQGIPSLQKLITIEGRFCELELSICENEGVKTSKTLELGPLLRHILVLHYFLLSSDNTEVTPIRYCTSRKN